MDSINRLVGMVVDLKLAGLTKHYDAAAAFSDTSLISVGGLTDLTDECLDDLSWRHNRARLKKVKHGDSGILLKIGASDPPKARTDHSLAAHSKFAACSRGWIAR